MRECCGRNPEEMTSTVRAVLRVLTRSWFVELESSSGNGFETPRATQLAKMANRIKISNGLRQRRLTQ